MREKIWNNLGNLEGCLAKLDDQCNLINILENNYFDTMEADKFKLAWEYKRYQSLLFTIHDEILDISDMLKKNIHEMYTNIK